MIITAPEEPPGHVTRRGVVITLLSAGTQCWHRCGRHRWLIQPEPEPESESGRCRIKYATASFSDPPCYGLPRTDSRCMPNGLDSFAARFPEHRKLHSSLPPASHSDL